MTIEVEEQQAAPGATIDDGERARDPRAWLLALVAGAGVWMAVGIGRRPFWQDEALSVGATTQLVRTWKDTGGTMGAYYALLTPWSQVSTDRTWLRLLSLVLALAVVPLLYRFAREVGDHVLARTASLALIGSWLFVRYAQEARSYALALLLTTAGWLALVRWVRSPDQSRDGRRWLLLYSATAVLAVLSHGLTGLQVLAQLATLLLLPDRRDRLRAVAPAVAATIVALAVLTSLGAAEVANWVPPLSLHQVHDLLQALTGPSLPAQLLLGGAVVAGAAFAFAAYRRAPSSAEGWVHAVVVVWALAPPLVLVAVSVVRPYLVPRYALGSVPGLALLVALALEPLRRHRAHLVAVAVVVAVLVAGRVSLYREPGVDWAGAARVVAEEARPTDVVAFPTQAVRAPFDVAWGELDTPGADPEVISPVGPLGEVHRFYPYHGDAKVLTLLAEQAPDRIWVVSAITVGSGDTLQPFLDEPALGAYRVVERHPFAGDLEVVLLQLR